MTTMTKSLVYPPRMTEFTSVFWDGLREGLFQTSMCTQCRHMTFPPKPVCPECWSESVQWVELSGRGLLRSFTEVSAAPAMFADDAPYVLCIVDLEEGVRVLSRILASWDELSIDAPVQVQVRPAEPNFLFDFVLADPTNGQVEA
jgi:uncharacterized protein